MENEKNIEATIERITKQEILTNVSAWVQASFDKELFNYEDIENAYPIEDDHTNDDDYTEPQKIYEWWMITPWLVEKLREKGEPVLDNDYGVFWGRTCTGQSITLDSVMQEIARDLLKVFATYK